MSSRIVGVQNALHTRLRTQARNLLFEYKYGVTDGERGRLRGHVPVEHVQQLMQLYGNLIIDLMIDDLSKSVEINQAHGGNDLDENTRRITTFKESK